MRLILPLFTTLLFSTAAAVGKTSPRDTVKYPASLVGSYTQLDSTEFLKELDFGAPGNATFGHDIKYKKLIVLCRYTYCRGWFDNKFAKSCSRKCGTVAHLWDVKAIEGRIKKLAKRRKPWHKMDECIDDCQAECLKNQNCECRYLCETYWYDPRRKQYEVDLNDFLRNLRDVGRLTKLM